MTNGMTLVVKRIKDMNKLGREGFDAEMRRFGRFRHQNVLTPLAYHYRKDEKLLVHKHIAKGSLLYLLHGMTLLLIKFIVLANQPQNRL